MGVTKPKINTWYLNFSEIWSSLLPVIEMFEILVTWSVNVCVHEVKPLSLSLDLGVDRLKFAEAFECVIILCFWNPLTVKVHCHLYHVYISFYLPLRTLSNLRFWQDSISWGLIFAILKEGIKFHNFSIFNFILFFKNSELFKIPRECGTTISFNSLLPRSDC